MPAQEIKPAGRYWFIVVRGMLRFVAILVAMFSLAGRLSYWQAWGYGAGGLLIGLVIAVRFAGKSDLIEERVRPGPGMKWWDKIFFALYMEFEVQGQVHHPQRGDELLIPAGVVHSARNIGSTTARWLYGYRSDS